MWSAVWNGVNTMETVQIVLDRELLQATDSAARRTKQNRSALVRNALRQHLKTLDIRAKEEQEKAAYLRYPRAVDEVTLWEGEAVWPAE